MGPDPIILVRIHNAAFDKTSPVYYFRFQAKAGGSGSGQDREATVRDYLRSREGCVLVAPLLIKKLELNTRKNTATTAHHTILFLF